MYKLSYYCLSDFKRDFLSDRRKRLHELLIALINKEADFELIEENSDEFTSNLSNNEIVNFSKVIKKNRKILKKYQSLVRSAVTLDGFNK